jgi:hypothetical protein
MDPLSGRFRLNLGIVERTLCSFAGVLDGDPPKRYRSQFAYRQESETHGDNKGLRTNSKELNS